MKVAEKLQVHVSAEDSINKTYVLLMDNFKGYQTFLGNWDRI